MTLSAEFFASVRLLTTVAAELALVVAVAEGLARATRSAPWRRIIWQGCAVGTLILLAVEMSGTGRTLAGWVGRIPVPDSQATPGRSEQLGHGALERQRVSLNTEPLATQKGAVSLLPSGHSRSISVSPETPSGFAMQPESPIALDAVGLILVWFGVAGCLVGRAIVARWICRFALGRVGSVRPSDGAVSIEALARALGIRRRVRLVESSRLRSPVAFGWWRPSIGIPTGLRAGFDPVQQEVMFAHELAHLAGRDPFWYFLADLASAVLWWHPLAWFARRRMHEACENAADEASLLVRDGPRVLAECLVKLGAQLAGPRLFGTPGIEGTGFRSGLGRRVERLYALEGRSWQSPDRVRSIFVRTVGPLLMVGTAILCSGWALPKTFNSGETVKTIHNTWKNTLVAVALFAGVEPTGLPATPSSASPAPVAVQAESIAPETPESSARVLTADEKLVTEMEKLEAMKLKLQEALSAAPGKQAGVVPSNLAGETHQMMFQYGLVPKVVVAATGLGSAGRARPTPSIQSVQLKLDQIILNEVTFDGLPLTEVMKFLSDESRKRDSEKIGINFLINPNSPAGVSSSIGIDPTTGVPVSAPLAEPIDINSVLVKFSLPLRNVRLNDVLNAVVKVADKPIQFSVEEYGVVFSPAAGSATVSATTQSSPLAVRTFRVDTNTFLAGLENAFGITLGDSSAAAGAADRARRSREIQGALRKLLAQVGVNMEEPNKAVFYNDLTGVLMVRGTANDLELVAAAIETLGGAANGQASLETGGSAGFGLNAEMMRRYGLLPSHTPAP